MQGKKMTNMQAELRHMLYKQLPTLAFLYDSCLKFLDEYDENELEARVTLLLLGHCVREIMNTLPNTLNVGIGTSRHEEEDAKQKLDKTLSSIDLTKALAGKADAALDTVPIPRAVAEAILDYRQARLLGTKTDASKMAAIFMGDSNARGGSLRAVLKAKNFFMSSTHFDRTEKSSLPTLEDVRAEFSVLEYALSARLGDFFAAKKRIQSFLSIANRKGDKGEYQCPSEAEVETGLALAADQNLSSVFFAALENPLWLKKLIQHKALTNLSTEESMGKWPEHAYLQKMSSLVPEDVCTALSTAGPESTELVRGTVLSCASRMPANYAQTLVSKLLQWSKDEVTLESYWWNPEVLSELFKTLLEDEDARENGSKLLQSLYCPRLRKENAEKKQYHNEYISCIPSYYYEESLLDALQWLPIQRRLVILRRFTQKIESASAFDEEIRTAFIWPAVSAVCFEGEKDVEEQIVRILSIVLDEALEKDEELFEKYLLDGRYHIIQRTAMYVLANAIIVATDERLDKYLKIADSVFLCSGILDGDYDSELYPLVRAACDRRPNFSVVGLLSGFEDSIGRYRERYERVPFNSVNLEEADKVEMVEKRARMQRHRILSLIGKEHLPGEYLEEFTELENEFGDVTYQERRSFPVQMQIGPTSPMTLEQMKSMAPGELLSYLSTCKINSNDFSSMDSHRGQANTLQTLVSAEPYWFTGFDGDIVELRPTYISAIMNGWSVAVQDRRDVPLQALIDVCHYAAMIPDETACPSEGSPFDDDPSFDNLRLAVAHLLEAVVSHLDANEIDGLQDEILDVLIALGASKFPIVNGENESDEYGTDPVTRSINGTRTVAVQALGRWIYRFGESERKGEALAAIEKCLPSKSNLLCDAAAIGLAMPYLVTTAEEWAVAHSNDILGEIDASVCEQTILATTLQYYAYSDRLFDYFRASMMNVLRSGARDYVLDQHRNKRTLSWHVGFWTMVALLRGSISLDDELYAHWEEEAGDVCQCGVLRVCFQSFRNQEFVPTVIRVKAAYLWDRYAERHLSVNTVTDIFDALKALIDSGFYSPVWWVPRLERVLDIGIDEMRIFRIRNKLIELSEADPGEAIVILNKAISRIPTERVPRYLIERVSVPILANVLRSGDDAVLKTAREVMSRLGRKGLTNLDDLVEEHAKGALLA